MKCEPRDWTDHPVFSLGRVSEDRGEFLSTMEDWIRPMDQWCQNTGRPRVDVPSWGALADILYAQKYTSERTSVAKNRPYTHNMRVLSEIDHTPIRTALFLLHLPRSVWHPLSEFHIDLI
jgi:hypothetical protein